MTQNLSVCGEAKKCRKKTFLGFGIFKKKVETLRGASNGNRRDSRFTPEFPNKRSVFRFSLFFGLFFEDFAGNKLQTSMN